MRSALRGKTAEARGLRDARSMLRESPGRRARFHGGLNGFVVQLRRSAFICVHLRFLFCRGHRGLRALARPACSSQTGRAEAPPHPVRDQRTPSPSVPEAISRRTVLKRRPLAKPISGSKHAGITRTRRGRRQRTSFERPRCSFPPSRFPFPTSASRAP